MCCLNVAFSADKLENREVENINRSNRKSPASNSSKEADEGYCRSPSLPRTILGSQGEDDDDSVDNFAYLRKQAEQSIEKQSLSGNHFLKICICWNGIHQLIVYMLSQIIFSFKWCYVLLNFRW